MNLVAVLSVYNERKNLKELIRQIYPYVDRILIIDGRYKDFPGESHLSDYRGASLEDILVIIDGQTINYQIHKNLQSLGMFYELYIGKVFSTPISIVLPKKPWDTEMQKRSVMFHYGTFGDWFLIIDGDERIRHPANWAALRYFLEKEVDPHTLIVGLMTYDHKTGLKWYTSKLIRYRPETEYYGNHYTLRFWDSIYKVTQDQEGNEYEIFNWEEVLYDMVNDGSRREDVDFIELDHLDRKKLDPERNALRQKYYLRVKGIEEPNLYSVGENRYRRQIERWTMKPIEEETRKAIMKEIKDWTD